MLIVCCDHPKEVPKAKLKPLGHSYPVQSSLEAKIYPHSSWA